MTAALLDAMIEVMRLLLATFASVLLLGAMTGCEDLPDGCAPTCHPGVTVRAVMGTPMTPGLYDLTITSGNQVINGAVEVAEDRQASCNPPLECFSNCSETLCADVIGVLDGVSLTIAVSDPAAHSGPANFTLAIDYDGERLGEESFTPTYDPHVSRCQPCLIADGVEMTLAVPASSSSRADSRD